jgi:tetratricopeptide (TPR) repeat protein
MGKHLDRAEILIEQNRYDLAEVAVRQEIAENPDSDRGYSTLALCLVSQRKLGGETLDLINYALSLNAENDWNHYLLAMYWCDLCDFDRARSAIDTAIELDPNSEYYFYLLAFILFAQGENKFEHKSLSFFNLSFLHESCFIRPDLEPVFTPIEQSLALNPEYLPTLNLLTKLLIRIGKNRQALRNSLSALSLDPNDEDAHDLHGQILTKDGKYSAAVESFKSALSIDPTLKSAKKGLLEAMRSQYWIYPWITITNWRGRLLLFVIFPFLIVVIKVAEKESSRFLRGKMSISLSTLEFLIITFFVIVPLFIVWIFIASMIGAILFILISENLIIGLGILVTLMTIVIISFPAQWIFNLFLKVDPKNKLLFSVLDSVIANYVTGLTITILISVYTYVAMSFYQLPARSVIHMLWIVGGIFTTLATFLPTNSRSYWGSQSSGSRKLAIYYQLIVGIFGTSALWLYPQFGTLGALGYVLTFLVLLSPLAIVFISDDVDNMF